MKKAPLTFLLPLFLLWNVVLHAQTYQPLSLDGFNEDVIANGIGTAVSSTTNDIDGVSYCLRSLDWKLTAESQPMTSGLPTNGSITSQDSTTPNLLFQLQDYSSNNVIRLKTTVNTITSNVGGQVKSQNIYILATSTSGSSVLECKVIFEDDSFQVMSITLPDWYNGTNLSVAFQGFGRINRMNNMLENSTTNPRLYQFPIPITLENQTKAIKSIAFSHVEGQGISSVFGATAELVPSCPNPTSIIINQITSSTAKANITPPNIAPDRGYDFQVRSYGNPSDGNTGFVVSGSTIASNLTVELPFLTSGETFYFYVRSKCSTTEFGDWLGPFVFTTLCETRGAFIENFESQPVGTVNNASLPGCWGKISTGNGYLYTSSASAYSGNHSLYLYNSNQNTGDLLVVSPPTNHLGNGGYRVRFRARSTASALSTLNVVTLEDPNTTVGMQSLATIPLTTSFKEYFVNFPAGTANYFGLAHGLSSEYQAIYMDDIRFEPIPSCLVPTDLTVSAVGLNTATIAWTATSSPNTEGYTYEIRTSGEAGSGTTGLAFSAQVDSNTRTVNLANLVAGTTYHAYVKANCTATEESYWTDAATFTPNWCTPTYVNGSSNHRITVVNIDEINFTDQIPSYTQRDRTAESIPDLTVGNTYTFNVTTTGYTGMGVAIDFNNDGVFDQQTEVSALSDYIPNNTQVYTATVTIPNTIATGNYRMRIWNRIANAGGMDDGADPCGSYNYGTWADYTVKILEVTPPPVAVDQVFCKNENKKVSDLTATGENIKWYASETATTALLPSTLLSSGTYYATQTIGGQESVRRTPIQVEIEDPKLNSISVSSSFQYNTQTQVILVGIRSVLGPYVLTWYEEETGGVSIPTPDIAVLPVGTHVYWVSTFSTAGCESKRSKITLVVNPLTLYVIPTAITKYYGDADPELRYTIYGGYSEIPLTGSLARDPGENVGSYAIRQGTLTTSSNYSLIMTTATLTISPAPLTVTADAKTKEMGAADPMLTYQVSGLKNGELAEDVLTGTLTRDPGEETGVYPITQGTLASTSANYAMRYQPANLTIRTTTIVVQANDKTKVYGDTDPTLTYTVSGLDPAVDPSTVLMGSLSREPGENVSSYAITQGTLTAVAGYTLQFEAADLTITPATVTITAEAKTKVYGDTDPTLTYTVNGLKGTDTLTGSLVREVGETVGTYEIQQGSVAASTDYTLVYQAADLDITPATVTITAEAKTKVYGDTDPLLTYTVHGLKGTDTLTGSLVREVGETVGTYEIQQGSVAASTDYTLVYQAADLDITPATVTITAEAKTKVYGDTDPLLTYTVHGLKGTDQLTGSLVREVGEAVGTYEIQQGSLAASTDYTLVYQAADLDITPVTVTITAEAKTKVYGDIDPILTYTVRGLKGTDTLTGSLVREVGEAVGTYEIQQGSLAASTDYTLVYQAADLDITPATVTITAEAKTKVYGDTDPLLTYTVRGLKGTDTLTGSLVREVGEAVGTYEIQQGSLAASTDYTLVYQAADLDITPATVTITAEAKTKVYGDTDPTLTYTVRGLKGTDTLTGSLVREVGETVGTYEIQQGSLAASTDYTVVYQAADLTITPATVTITAEAKTKVYGDTDPLLTYTVHGLKGTDQLTGSLVREVGEAVGTYEIQQGSLAASTDYTVVYQAADLDITPATVTITAEAKTKVYGDIDPILTYTVRGLKGTDTLTGSLVREVGEAVGTYEIQQGSVAASTDYTLVYQAADLDITPATVTITAEAKTKVYGDTDPLLTYTVRGLKGTDTLTGSLVREVGEAVGTYEIQQGSVAASTDYTLVYQAADLTITPATVTITAEAKTKVYGDTDPLLTYTVSGLKGTDALTGSLVRQVGESVGTYEIQQGSLAASTDYTLVYQAADFTIFPVELVIYPQQNQEKEYGTDDPTLAFTVEGLRNGDTIATALRGALGRSTSENVGRYRYTLGSLESIANNYVLRLNTEERFEITPAPVAIVVEIGQYKHYGQADPVLRYEIQGLRRGDYPANTMTGQLKREPGEEVGQYTIVQGSLAPRSNYTIRSFTTASFEIKRGEIQGLILPSKTVVYDGEPQYLQVEGPLSLGAVVTYENNGQTQVGRYTVVATITDEPNYEPLRLVGTLTITPAEQHIRFGAVSTVVLEDTPSLPLQAVASSGLAVTYTIDDPAEQALAQVDAAGVIHFLQAGVVTVTAHQEGNANYKAAAPVSQTIEISSRDASIWNLLVDGVSHGKIEKVVELVLDCSTPQEEVILEIITQVGAVVSPSNYITVPVTTYGIHEQVIVVQSANGQVTTTYTIRIDKRIPTERIVFQKYDKVLLVNNNKQTNGGYVFSGYEWFKNGMSLGKKQFYAEQGDAGTTLDVDAEYLVELTLHNGQKIRSCPIFIQGKTTENWAVYPNPVQKSAWLYVRLEEEARQEATTYKIYNITGQLIKSGALDKGKMGIEIPSTVAAGSYYLVLNRAGKQQGIQFIVQ